MKRYKKLLIIIGVPILMPIFVGGLAFHDILWFMKIDYSAKGAGSFFAHVALLSVIMSACLKMMVYNLERYKNR